MVIFPVYQVVGAGGTLGVGAWVGEAVPLVRRVEPAVELVLGVLENDIGIVGDNYSEILAVEPGRAKNRAPNTACQHAAALQFVSGNRWPRRHVSTKDNFSDADSRLADAGLLAPGQRLYGAAVERHLERLFQSAIKRER